MKKINLFILAVILLSNLSAQIQSFVFDSYKDYDSQTRIAYFNIVGLNDIDELYYVKKCLNNNNLIYRIEIYDRIDNYYPCFIETTPEIDENEIELLINNSIKELNSIKGKYKDNILFFYKEIYSIPDDCPIFEYFPINEENNDAFIEKMLEWKESNIEKYNEIKHLKNKLNISDNKK